MQNAQVSSLVTLGVIALVVGVIGLVVFEGVEEPVCNTQNQTCTTGNWTNNTYFQLPKYPIEDGSQYAYNTTNCTGTALVEGNNYTMNNTNGGIIMNTTNYYNISANKSISYKYYDANYIGGTTCTVVDNTPVLFAVGLLILAGTWWLTR